MSPRRPTDSTLRPPPLPTGLAVDVVPAALAGLVERAVRAELARHHLAMFLSGAAGVGWMP